MLTPYIVNNWKSIVTKLLSLQEIVTRNEQRDLKFTNMANCVLNDIEYTVFVVICFSFLIGWKLEQ